MLFCQCFDRLGETSQAAADGTLKFLNVVGAARKLPHHGLYEREDVLRTVHEFLQDEMDAVFGFRTVEGGIGQGDSDLICLNDLGPFR